MTATENPGRAALLADVRRALGRAGASETHHAAVAARLEARLRGPIPARTALPWDGLVDLFVTMSEQVGVEVRRLAKLDEVPGVFAARLAALEVGGGQVMAPHPLLRGLPWPGNDAPRAGPARGDDRAALTLAAGAVAETGTLIFVSGPEHPSNLAFLPELQIVVLRGGDLCATYEDFWDRRREAGAPTPATVNMITGASRTGDIEQIILLGAHGPKRVEILLVDDAPQAS